MDAHPIADVNHVQAYRGAAVGAVVLGILSIPAVYVPLLNFLFAVLGLIYGYRARQGIWPRVAQAGMVLSGIGMVLFVLVATRIVFWLPL